MKVAVIGTGLIGTSIALALREHGSTVWLADSDPATVRLAADLGAGEPMPARGTADVAVIAVPPAAVAATLAAAQARQLARCYTDVASVKQFPVGQAREQGCDLTCYVPGHPLAGREKHGPAAARADLFLGRTWALCPVPETSEAAIQAVTDLVQACEMSATQRSCPAGSMRTGTAPHTRTNSVTVSVARLVVSGSGHSAQVRPRNRSARAAAGPCFSRPASGCPGT